VASGTRAHGVGGAIGDVVFAAVVSQQGGQGGGQARVRVSRAMVRVTGEWARSGLKDLMRDFVEGKTWKRVMLDRTKYRKGWARTRTRTRRWKR
jgi:hypothetical protein